MSTHGAGATTSAVAERARKGARGAEQKAPTLTASGKRVGRPPKSAEEKAATAAARKEKAAAARRGKAQAAKTAKAAKNLSLNERAVSLAEQIAAAQRAGDIAKRDALMAQLDAVKAAYRGDNTPAHTPLAATTAARKETAATARRGATSRLPDGTRVFNAANGRSQLDAKTNQAARELLGQTLSRADWAALVGAQPGDGVSISGTHIGTTHGQMPIVNITLMSKNGSYGNPGGYRADRSIQRDSEGKTFLFNAKFYVDQSVQGQGIGTRVLGSEIATATRLGISYLETSPMNPRAKQTWTQMGFRPTKSAEGEDVYRFDLTPGSQSHRTYNAYVRSRARRAKQQSS